MIFFLCDSSENLQCKILYKKKKKKKMICQLLMYRDLWPIFSDGMSLLLHKFTVTLKARITTAAENILISYFTEKKLDILCESSA